MREGNNRTQRGGSALIIALWTIGLLSMLVMSFALDAMLEGRISTYVRQRRRVEPQRGVGLPHAADARR